MGPGNQTQVIRLGASDFCINHLAGHFTLLFSVFGIAECDGAGGIIEEC